MNILCAVKFVPDVDSVAIDVENLAGTSSRRILNPDDACALAEAADAVLEPEGGAHYGRQVQQA